MIRVELRREERRQPVRRPKGTVTLKTSLGDHSVDDIRNISKSGISVHIEQMIPSHSPVSIEYVDEGFRLQVKGTVAWCVPRHASAPEHSDSGGYVLGIELLSPMLFRAIYDEG